MRASVSSPGGSTKGDVVERKEAAIRASSSTSGYFKMASTIMRLILGIRGNSTISFPMEERVLSSSKAPSIRSVSTAPAMPS